MINHNQGVQGNVMIENPQEFAVERSRYDTIGKIESEMNRSVYIPQDDLKALVGGLATENNVLIDGEPGTGKSTIARALGNIIGGTTGIIYGTEELTSGDITGSLIFDQRNRDYRFNEGPVFSNVVFVEEVHRIKGAQAGLLQSMQDGVVTPSGSKETYSLPDPHFFVATKNPSFSSVLEKALIDRFGIGIEMNYDTAEEREKVLSVIGVKKYGRYKTQQQIDLDSVVELRERTDDVNVPKEVQSRANYFLDRVREHKMVDAESSNKSGSRGVLTLLELAKFSALHVKGHMPVDDKDVAFAAPYVLNHRIVPSYEAVEKGISTKMIVQDVIRDFFHS